MFSIQEYENRWARVEAAMLSRKLEAAVVWGRTASTFDRAGDVIYLTNYFSSKVGQGFDSPPFNARAYCSVLLRPGSEPILIADDPDVRADCVSVRQFKAADDPVAMTMDVLQDLQVSGRVGFVGSDFFPVKYWHQVQSHSPHIQWEMCDDLVRQVRMRKSPAERDIIRRAGEISTEAMSRMMEMLIDGRSEAEAAAEGARSVVAAGGVVDKIQISHGETIAYTCGDPMTGYRRIAPKPGDMLRGFIIGPFFQGYYLDPGRSAVCGNRPTTGQAAILEACCEIIEAIAAEIKPGFLFSEAAAIGDRMVADFGPDEDPAAKKFPFFGHPHGVYFEGPPYISSVLDHGGICFEEGMLIGVEAFLAREGIGNVGFEQNYLVTGDGVELITRTPMLWH